MKRKLLTFLALLTVIFALPQAASAAIYVGGYNGSWTFNSDNQMTQVGTSTIYYFRAEKSKLYQKTFKIVENGNTYYGLPASGNYWIGTFDEQKLSTGTQDLYFKENTYDYYDIIYNSNDHKFIIRPSICIYYWGGSTLSNKETDLYMTPSTLSTYTYSLGNVTATTSSPLNILIKVKGVWDQRWGISGAITPNANAVNASHYGNEEGKETKLQNNLNNAVVTFTAPSSLSGAGKIQITGTSPTPTYHELYVYGGIGHTSSNWNVSDISGTDGKMTTSDGVTYTWSTTSPVSGNMRYFRVYDKTDNKFWGWNANDDFYLNSEDTYSGTLVEGGTGAIFINKNSLPNGVTVTFNLTDHTAKYSGTASNTNNVMMPLTAKDFASGPRYFIVGARMGAWKLQPEWELKPDGNGNVVLEGRFIYDTTIGVAKVTSYNDYIYHCYTLYGPTTNNFNFDSTHTSTALKQTKATMTSVKTATKSGVDNPSESERGYTNFDNSVWEGAGKYVKKITVALSSGNPSNLAFTLGSDNDAVQNRMFSLLGSAIYNSEFCNTKGGGKTHLYNTGTYRHDDWQEGWIQYDSITQKPFIDGNGEYLYHTSFTPNYMTANKVYFNYEKPNGEVMAYTSDGINFVESSQLKHLDSDPYKDFYNSINGRGGIVTSTTAKTGNGYNYKVNVVKSTDDSNISSTSADWKCYVVKDFWMEGEFKVWSGWGGNSDYLMWGSGDSSIAHWHGPNGGPNETRTIQGFDINAGKSVNLYRNRKNKQINYQLAKPTYFNRVILWYNTADGIDGSFLQFIQEAAGPAIFAKVNSGTKNYIDYNWYLQNIDESNSDTEVVKYTITRYRVSSEGDTPNGHPLKGSVAEDEVTISYTVNQLSETNAGNSSNAQYTTTHTTDTGIISGQGLSAGTYRYGIVVTYKDGTTKSALSNPVTIYDESNAIPPQAVPMQLVELRHTNIASTLSSTMASEVSGYTYLTYRTEDNANYYVLTRKADGTPNSVKQISSATAQAIFNDPTLYVWTSDYYIRCLDMDIFERQIEIQQSQGLMPEQADAITPVIKIYDYYPGASDVETYGQVDEQGKECVYRSDAGLYTLVSGSNAKRYYAAIFDRQGELYDANLQVRMTYTFKDEDSHVMTRNSKANAGIDPVTPRAWGAKYEYRHAALRDEDGNIQYDNKGEEIPDIQPSVNVKSVYGYGDWLYFEVPSATPHKVNVPVLMKADDLDPRQLDVVFTFQRPNVDKDIMKYYDITYDIDVETNYHNEHTLSASGVYYDEHTGEYLPDQYYSIRVLGVHPSQSFYPTLKVKSTRYERHVDGEDPNNDGFEATYGDNITLDATSVTEKKGGSLTGLKINYADSELKTQYANNPNDALNAGWAEYLKQPGFTTEGRSWMYFGHSEFIDEGDVLVTGNEDQTQLEIYNESSNNPHYYLIETYIDDNNHASYAYLVKHQAGHLNDENYVDPLSGKWIAHGFTSEDVPTVYVTPIYIFNRLGEGVGTETMAQNSTAEFSLKRLGIDASSNVSKAPRRLPAQNEYLDEANYTGVKLAGYTKAAAQADNMKITSFAPGGSAAGELTASAGGEIAGTAIDTPTGIESIRLDNSDYEAEYFNLQGIRVENPVKGQVYVVRRGAAVTKEVLR